MLSMLPVAPQSRKKNGTTVGTAMMATMDSKMELKLVMAQTAAVILVPVLKTFSLTSTKKVIRTSTSTIAHPTITTTAITTTRVPHHRTTNMRPLVTLPSSEAGS